MSVLFQCLKFSHDCGNLGLIVERAGDMLVITTRDDQKLCIINSYCVHDIYAEAVNLKRLVL